MSTGTSLWLAQRGQRLGQVIELNNRLCVDGTLHLTACACLLDTFLDSTGRLDICDDATGMVYCAQALDYWSDYDTITLACSTLGHVNDDYEDDRDDDYLVVEGYAPMPITAWVHTDSGCKRGPHMRFETPVASWHALATEPQPQPDPTEANHWHFDEARLITDGRAQPLQAEVVRLRQRQILRVEVDRAMTAARSAVGIGHVIAEQAWPSRHRNQGTASR